VTALSTQTTQATDGTQTARAAHTLAAVRRTRAHRLRHHALLHGTLAVAVAALFLVDVLLGGYTVTVPDFWTLLTGGRVEAAPAARFIVMEDKLPRAVVATLTGLAFGAAGGAFQTLLRNPLASPDVLGITAGASTAAVTAMVVGASGAAVTGSALAGALAVAVLIALLARPGRGAGGTGLGGTGLGGAGLGGTRLILVGIGCAALLQAITSYLLTRTDITTAGDALVWLNGSLNGATWDRVATLGLALCVLLPLTALAARPMGGLELGDDTAAALGLRVAASRALLLLAAVALAAVATAAAGPVAFVPLLAGNIARRLGGGRTSLLAAALVGAAVMLGAEYLAVNLIPDTRLPVGVVTGALGAPFLLLLLVKVHRVGRGG
jgi:iron complex transport system permease protein